MVGEDRWPTNPRHSLAPHWREFLELWLACRGDFGIAHWPDPGGVADQAAWIVEAFALLNAIAAKPKDGG